jgi:hypothetical protein
MVEGANYQMLEVVRGAIYLIQVMVIHQVLVAEAMEVNLQ